jgi:protein O-GlcNAc transferase
MAITRELVGELLGLYAAKRFAAMEQRARALQRSDADNAILHELLGVALAAQDRHAEALDELSGAVAAEPNDPQFWENLALCQRQLGDFERSEASLRRSLGLRPRSVETLNALGSVLRSLRRYDESADILRQALALDPNYLATRLNLANVLFDGGAYGDAELLVRQVLAANAALPAPYVCLGAILVETGRAAEAADAAQAICNIVGGLNDFNDAKADLLDSAAGLFVSADRNSAAAEIYRATLAYRKIAVRPAAMMWVARRVCDWDLADLVEPQCRAATRMPWPPGAGTVFPLLAVAGLGPSDLLLAARNYAQQFAFAGHSSPTLPATPPVGSAASHGDRLRIGYLTRDLGNLPVGYLVVGAIEAHDRNDFEVFAYDYTPPSTGAFRDRLEAAFDRVIRIDTLSDSEAARRIGDDACDIVIDLTGWTAGARGRILATRPAAVQVQWLGYPGTMGAPWLDYIIVDRVLICPGEEIYYSEKVVRLPHCYQPSDAKRIAAAPRSRRDYGLPEQALVFCSFNQAYKITREIFAAWMELLSAVDDSVLWLLQYDPEATRALQRAAQARGVAPERLIFAHFLPQAEHLARASVADLALDCFPYGSHTTASDMLWAGVPLVALAGDTFASRVSASILTVAGLSELVTHSIADYRALAQRLATDRAALAQLKAKVAQSRAASPLFDTAGFTRGLEKAFVAMSQRRRAGLQADHIDID